MIHKNRVAIVLMALACCYHSRTIRAVENPVTTKTTLRNVLVKLGEDADCYFTLETIAPAKLSLSDQLDAPEVTITTSDEAVHYLRNKLPGASITMNQQNAAVIHILAGSPDAIKPYSLNQSIPLFTYTGPIGSLVNKIGESFNLPIKRRPWQRGAGAIVSIFPDRTVTYNFVTHNQSVRQILTNYTPLSRYQRIIWQADTTQQNQTFVTYCGLLPKGYPGLNAEFVGFETGIRSYGNPVSLEVINQALHFVDAKMKSPNSNQARWAMLWLGKNKVEKGIPVLLKYLDYEYASAELWEERFPALLALQDIGSATVEPAKEQLTKDSSPRRLELLCRLILNVQGNGAGSKTIDTVCKALADVKQKENIQSACKRVKEQVSSATVVWVEDMRNKVNAPAP